MRHTSFKFALTTGVFLSLFASITRAQGDEAIIVKCTRPCAAVTAAVAAAGGVITERYRNVDAVAARVPSSAVPGLVSLAGADAVVKDIEIGAPRPAVLTPVADPATLLSDPAAVQAAELQPADYNFNLAFTNVAPLHAAGKRGNDVVVAVIDSGTTSASGVVTLAGSVIGGETFIPPAVDPLSATHRENGSHGTLTAGMVAAHATFLFLNTSPLVAALNRHAPGSAIACTSFPGNCGLPPAVAAIASAVPVTGTAPAARIYAMKVFPATGGGAPSSRIIAAMDKAITLRRTYNSTGVNTVASGTGTETDPFVYSSLKIDVVNMSLGGLTLIAGRDIEDQLTLEMLDAGITVVVAAGNDGFAAMTVESPGTGFGSLTVGAANTVVHERVLRELQLGPGGGELYRPSSHHQTADFSGRGPNADGRLDPDISANGFASFGQAFIGLTAQGALADCREPGAVAGSCIPRLVFISGTSLSTPTVAGAAAVLRGAHPDSNATQVRNALQKSANPNVLGDDSTQIDQGNGIVDVAAAAALLTSGHVSSTVPDLPRSSGHDDDEDELGAGGKSVLRNVQRAGFPLARFHGNRFSTRIRNLKPGEVAQIFVPSDFLTSKLTVTIDNVTPELPPEEQNQFFICGPQGGEFLCGDDVFVQIVDAPTSSAFLLEAGFPNSREGLTTEIPNPQTGLVRVALQGDSTNGGRVSATVTITRTRKFDGLPTALSLVEQDEIDFVEVDVPAGASQAVFELAWKQNWGRYPTNDLDLVLIDPAGMVNNSGATISSPERAEIANPMPGRWRAAIIGFTIHGQRDLYSFRAEADGRRLRKVQ
jgi:hypothetical protein